MVFVAIILPVLILLYNRPVKKHELSAFSMEIFFVNTWNSHAVLTGHQNSLSFVSQGLPQGK